MQSTSRQLPIFLPCTAVNIDPQSQMSRHCVTPGSNIINFSSDPNWDECREALQSPIIFCIKNLLPTDTGHKDFEKRTDVITKTMGNTLQDISTIPVKIMEFIEHLANFALHPVWNTMSP